MTEHLPNYVGRDNHTTAETSREPYEENRTNGLVRDAQAANSIEELRKAGATWRKKLLN